MAVTIKYFGRIAEATQQDEERLELHTHTVTELLTQLKTQYPILGNANFKIAVNQQVVTDTAIIPEGAEVALLPPFAGG